MKPDRLYDLIKDLDYNYDRVRYYDDSPARPKLLEMLDSWRKEAREAWNAQDADDDFNASEKEDLIDSQSEEIHTLRRSLSKEKIAHGETKTELAKVKASLEAVENDYLLFQSALIGVVPKDKLDDVLKRVKNMNAALDGADQKQEN